MVSEFRTEADNLALKFKNVGFRYCINQLPSFQFTDIFPSQIPFGYQQLHKSCAGKCLQLSTIILFPLNPVETPKAL